MFLKNEFFDSPGILGCTTIDDWKKELFFRYPSLRTDTFYDNWISTNKINMFSKVFSNFIETKEYDSDFLYTHNEYGFRDNDLSTSVDICYYGCSVTYGVGVPEETRWTNIVDKEFNFNSNNFGITGIGATEMLNLFISSLKFVKMKYAIFLIPDMHRCNMPIISDSGISYRQLHKNYVPVPNESFDKITTEAAHHYYSLPETYYYDILRNCKEMISYIGKLNNIQVYVGSWLKIPPEFLSKAPDYVGLLINDKRGRDMSHPGIIAHKNFANLIIERINNDKGEKL